MIVFVFPLAPNRLTLVLVVLCCVFIHPLAPNQIVLVQSSESPLTASDHDAVMHELDTSHLDYLIRWTLHSNLF